MIFLVGKRYLSYGNKILSGIAKNYFMATKFFYAFTLVIRNRKVFMKFLFTSFKLV